MLSVVMTRLTAKWKFMDWIFRTWTALLNRFGGRMFSTTPIGFGTTNVNKNSLTTRPWKTPACCSRLQKERALDGSFSSRLQIQPKRPTGRILRARFRWKHYSKNRACRTPFSGPPCCLVGNGTSSSTTLRGCYDGFPCLVSSDLEIIRFSPSMLRTSLKSPSPKAN